jgi:hypothetical protein
MVRVSVGVKGMVLTVSYIAGYGRLGLGLEL